MFFGDAPLLSTVQNDGTAALCLCNMAKHDYSYLINDVSVDKHMQARAAAKENKIAYVPAGDEGALRIYDGVNTAEISLGFSCADMSVVGWANENVVFCSESGYIVFDTASEKVAREIECKGKRLRDSSSVSSGYFIIGVSDDKNDKAQVYAYSVESGAAEHIKILDYYSPRQISWSNSQ